LERLKDFIILSILVHFQFILTHVLLINTHVTYNILLYTVTNLLENGELYGKWTWKKI